ncbi:hypothetical protein K7X08_001589 [Anisodus acutangulus]|uniref:GOLD domain-containing protein n=1 Tax=Anisodus acutangulus TaxID=402998 RepID=A0A9Q1MV93_9SOLA|nr:hypothetical protein K7X08_001589 [Anisodus acutangulus]
MMGKSSKLMYLAMVVCLLLQHKGEAIWLSLPASGTKCVSEELHNNVVVLADNVVISDDHVHPNLTISARGLTCSLAEMASLLGYWGNLAIWKHSHHKENITQSQFAFTTTEAGNYLACFWADNPGGGSLSVNIDWKIGIAAKDWESVARKEKIESFAAITFCPSFSWPKSLAVSIFGKSFVN